MTLVLAGIDEAGYGPLLGPLCVGMSVFEISQWQEGEKAPNLWTLLNRGVCRKPSDKRRRIAMDDSKKLKVSNAPDGRYACVHLERGVLAFLACMERFPGSDVELFEILGTSTEDHPWYSGEPGPCPVGHDASEIRIASNMLKRAFSSSDVKPLDLACCTVCEDKFNAITSRAGTKAATTTFAIAQHLRAIWDKYACDPESGSSLRIVVDRQSGRTDYGGFLEKALPGTTVDELDREPAVSRYRVTGTDSDSARQATILFRPEADSRQLPVALASMTAKLVREVLMARFNRHFCAIMPELKPTAGYRQDANRWLRDAEPILTPAARATMIRKA